MAAIVGAAGGFAVNGVRRNVGAAAPNRSSLANLRTTTRARLKVIILGGVAETADILRTIHDIFETENGMFATHPDDTAARRG
jgi:hypothetical protein